MFDWKVENMALMNEYGFLRMGNEKIYSCETQLSREDKIAFVDQMQDGKLSYILNLAEKFNNDKDGLPKDKYFNNVKTVSLKSWIKRNDTRKLVDNTIDYGKIFFVKTHRSIENINRKGNYDTYEDYVDEVFHRQLKECESEEKKYFLEHDEYSILKKQLRDVKHNTTFGVHLGFCSDGSIYLYDENDHDKERDITVDEIKLLLSKYEELDRYIEKISAEIDIKY